MRSFKSNYSFCEKMSLFFSLIYTKLFWPKARLIRKNRRIRGKKGIKYGEGFTTGYSARISVGGELTGKKLIIGKNVIIGDYVHIEANYKVSIGDNVLIASRVFITDTSHGSYKNDEQSLPSEKPNDRSLFFGEVKIGNNVWIGENVCILPNITIEDGCIVGANSVVTKSIPKNTIVAGNPAKEIKRFSELNNKWERC